MRWSGLGATHATELLAVFDVYRTTFGKLLTAAADRKTALRVSDDVQSRWQAFAHTGVPGDDWPAYRSPDRAVRVFDRRPRVEYDPHASRREAWAGFTLAGCSIRRRAGNRCASRRACGCVIPVVYPLDPARQRRVRGGGMRRPVHTTDVVERPSDLTAEWLTSAIGTPIAGFTYERIGTGQMSERNRVELSHAAEGAPGPPSVVLKVAATDPMSRQTGLALGLYEREVRFYTDIAPNLDCGRVAPGYSAGFDADTGAFHLLLGDADPAVVGDELRGATVEQAQLALEELAEVHAPALGDESMAQADWLNREAPLNQALIGQLYAGFLERYRDQISQEHRVVCDRLVESFDGYRSLPPPALRTVWCTAIIGLTTCFSASPVPTARSRWWTGRRLFGALR